MIKNNKLIQVMAYGVIKARNSLNKPSPIKYVSQEAIGASIPKIVHQTYFTKDLPAEINNIISKMKIDNPDWEFRLYDDLDIEIYINQHFANLVKFYKKINPKYGAARADFFRYLIMYNEGGVYLDIKSGLSKSLNQILNGQQKFILSHWPRHYPKTMLGQHNGISNLLGEYQQWHIISVKGHPFLEQVINNVCNNITNYNPLLHDFGSWGVFNLTGPIAYSEAIYPITSLHEHTIFEDHLAIGLEYVAISSTNKLAGHHTIFEKTHYSKLEESVVIQKPIFNALFKLLRPCIIYLKKMLKNSIQ